MGGIRIGTLHDFRKMEHAPGISDPNEGTKNIELRHNETEILLSNNPVKDSQIAKDIRNFMSMIRDVKNVRFKNMGAFTNKFNTPNCFILCISSSISKDTIKYFDGADTCLQIIDFHNFSEL